MIAERCLVVDGSVGNHADHAHNKVHMDYMVNNRVEYRSGPKNRAVDLELSRDNNNLRSG